MSGKALRLKRIVSPVDGRTVIFPLDHGVSWGPLPGLERIAGVIDTGVKAGADAIVLHKGMLRCLEPARGALPGIIMHLSASTSMGPAFYHKILAGSVEEAVRRGADAVSVQMTLGDTREPEMLRDLGRVGQSCEEWQIPLLVMAYAGGDRMQASATGADIAHAARVAAELGADVIKIPFPGDYDQLAGIVSGLPVPVVIAGGSPSGGIDCFLERIEMSVRAGAAGVAAGRGIFQHEDTGAILRAVCDIIHRGISAEKIMEDMQAKAKTWTKRT